MELIEMMFLAVLSVLFTFGIQCICTSLHAVQTDLKLIRASVQVLEPINYDSSDSSDSSEDDGEDDGVDGADGADGVDGADGADGVDGVDGVDGADGADGAAAGTTTA